MEKQVGKSPVLRGLIVTKLRCHVKLQALTAGVHVGGERQTDGGDVPVVPAGIWSV